MPVTHRLLVLWLSLLLSFAPVAMVAAQSTGPDPNNPVADPTPDDSSPGSGENSAPAVDNSTNPYLNEKVEVAAVTLDQDQVPKQFSEYGEFHLTIDEVKTRYAGQLEPEAIDATGLNDYYMSDFNDGKDQTVVITVLSFDKASQVQAGFDIFQNEETFFPNGALTDDAALDGVGEAPGEVTSGRLENGDGTQTSVYSATFTVGPLLISVEMDATNGADPDTDIIAKLADIQANRAEDVLDGNPVQGILYGLGNLIVYPTHMYSAFDGYALDNEDFLLRTMDTVPDGFLSAYGITYRMTQRADNFYPVFSTTLAAYDSTRALDKAMQDPKSLILPYDQLKQLDDPDIADADAVAAFTYSIQDGVDSIRIFAQSGTFLVIVDIEGTTALDDAIQIATAYAEADVNCIANGECAAPTGLPGQDDPTTDDFFGSATP